MGKFIIEKEDKEAVYLMYADEDGDVMVEGAYLTPYIEPDREKAAADAFQRGYEHAKHECADCRKIRADTEQELADKAYQRGLNDAWEAARKIIHMPEGDLLNIFTECYSAVCTALQVLLKYDASEAIEKILQYEQEKDKRARIEYNCEEIKDVLNTTMKECNVSLDEIAAVLEKMRESE